MGFMGNRMKKNMGRTAHTIIFVAAIVSAIFWSKITVLADNVVTGDYVPATLNGTTYCSADAKDFVNVNRYTLNSGGTNTTGDYYDLLSSTQKAIYIAIGKASVSPYTTNGAWKNDLTYAGLISGETTLDGADFICAQQAYAYDHPGQLECQLCSAYKAYDSDENLYLALYNSGGYNFSTMESALRAARVSFLASVDTSGSDAEVELNVHDAMINYVTYDDACANANNSHDTGHTAYGTLVEKSSVCDGYSVAYMYLLDSCDIKARVISGKAGTSSKMGGHAWNIVQLGSEWYEVDTTWDDQKTAKYMYYDGLIHKFYNLTTEQMSSYTQTSGTTYTDNTGTYDDYTETVTRTYLHQRYYVGALLEETGTSDTYNYSAVSALLDANDAKAITLDNYTHTFISVGDTVQLNATVLPLTATDRTVTWSSSDEKIAIVNEDGLVTCISDGKANITAVSNSGGYTATCIIGYGDIDVATLASDSDDIETADTSESDETNIIDESSTSDETNSTKKSDTSTEAYTETAGNTETTASISAAVGTVFKYGKGQYEVTGDREVAFKKPVKKTYSSFSIPQTITVDGCEYTVTSISAKAFYKYSKLKTITIPKYVMTIGNNAFNKCTSLKKITLPKYVKSIGKKTFYGCKNLKKVTIKSTQLTSIGKKAFRGVHKDIVYKLPDSKKKKYKSLIKKSS